MYDTVAVGSPAASHVLVSLCLHPIQQDFPGSESMKVQTEVVESRLATYLGAVGGKAGVDEG